jgi:hypothetical protein
VASASKLAASTTDAARPQSAAGASGAARPQGAAGGVVSSGGSMPEAGGSVLGGAGARASAGEADPAEIRRRRLGKEDNYHYICFLLLDFFSD